MKPPTFKPKEQSPADLVRSRGGKVSKDAHGQWIARLNKKGATGKTADEASEKVLNLT